MKRPDGITLIGLYHFLMAGLYVILFLGLLLIPVLVGVSTIATEVEDAHIPIAITSAVFLMVGFVVLIVGALNLVLGIGLWNMRPWSRIAVMILAAFRLFSFPVGTAIGGLTLWYLVQPDVEVLFKE